MQRRLHGAGARPGLLERLLQCTLAGLAGGTDLGQLGAANADALAVKSKALFSAAELKVKAEAAVKRREAAGISDSVERMQPDDAPPFDQRVRPHPSSHPHLHSRSRSRPYSHSHSHSPAPSRS